MSHHNLLRKVCWKFVIEPSWWISRHPPQQLFQSVTFSEKNRNCVKNFVSIKNSGGNLSPWLHSQMCHKHSLWSIDPKMFFLLFHSKVCCYVSQHDLPPDKVSWSPASPRPPTTDTGGHDTTEDHWSPHTRGRAPPPPCHPWHGRPIRLWGPDHGPAHTGLVFGSLSHLIHVHHFCCC